MFSCVSGQERSAYTLAFEDNCWAAAWQIWQLLQKLGDHSWARYWVERTRQNPSPSSFSGSFHVCKCSLDVSVEQIVEECLIALPEKD